MAASHFRETPTYLVYNLLGVLASPAVQFRQLFLDGEQLLLEKRNSFESGMIQTGSWSGNGTSTRGEPRFEI